MPSSFCKDWRLSKEGDRDELLLEGRDGKTWSGSTRSPFEEPWRSTSHRGRISRDLNSTEFGRRCRVWVGEVDVGESLPVAEGGTGTARDKPGDVGGRRKCKGTAVGDSATERAIDERRWASD